MSALKCCLLNLLTFACVASFSFGKSHPVNETCPKLREAKNANYLKKNGLWYKVEEARSDDEVHKCSWNLYQPTGPDNHNLIIRNEISGSNKSYLIEAKGEKLTEGSWLHSFIDTDRRNRNMHTLLAADYGCCQGYLLVHVCQQDGKQEVQIESRRRKLDSRIVEKLHRILDDSGLSRLRKRLFKVDHSHCSKMTQN